MTGTVAEDAARGGKRPGVGAAGSCETVTPKLGRFDREALPPDEAARVREHLLGCPSCRKELERRRVLRVSLSRLHLPPPPPGLWDRVMAVLQRQQGAD
jgi:hypothetical protein